MHFEYLPVRKYVGRTLGSLRIQLLPVYVPVSWVCEVPDKERVYSFTLTNEPIQYS